MLFRPDFVCRHKHMFSHVSLKLNNRQENMPVTKCRTVLARNQNGEDSGRLNHTPLAGTDQQVQTTEYSEAILTIITHTNEADLLRLHVDPVVLGLNPHRTNYLKLISAPKSTKPANGFEETCWDIKAAGVTMITSMIEHGLIFNNGLATLCTEIVSKNKKSVVIILIIDLWQFEASWILFVVSAATKNGTVIKCTITLNSWFLEKQDQQEVQYSSHTTEHLCVCSPCMLAAGLSFRSEQGLYQTRTFLQHSKCGQYSTQYKLNISISPGKQLVSEIATDLQNIFNSHNTIYHLPKTTYWAQKKNITSDSISEFIAGRTVRPNTCQSQNSFGRQMLILKKSTTVMFIATTSSMRDQAIYNSYSGCIYKRTKVDRFFNVPSPDQSLFCHRHTETAWPSKDCAICDCCCLTLNRAEGNSQIVFFRHIKNLPHKNVTMTYKDSVPMTTLLNVQVVTNGERAKGIQYRTETCRIVSIMFKAFLTHLSGIKTTECWTCLNLRSFASFAFFGMGETVLFHICVSELAGSEHRHLKSSFTFRLWPLNGTREITLVQPKLSERHISYRTCRLLTNDYWRTKQQSLRASFSSTGRKQTKCSLDHYDNQQILLGQDSWRRKHNHRVFSGQNVLNTMSTIQRLFLRLNRWGWEIIRREKIDDGDEVMAWLLLGLHPGTIEINGTVYRNEWLGKNAFYKNGKYEAIGETILDDNIRDKRQLCNPGVYKYDKYVATNRETNEDNQRHKSARLDEYTDGVHGRVINSRKYQAGILPESATFSNYIQDELRKITCLGKFQKNCIKLETNHSQCTNENMVETTNRNNCNNEDGSPQRQRRGWRRVNSRLTRELVTDRVQCEIVSTPTVLPVGNRAYTLNSTLQTDLQYSDVPRCPQTNSIAEHQQYLVMQAGQNRTSDTSHQRSLFLETGHYGSAGTSHQRSLFLETGHYGSAGTSYQRSLFPKTGHSGSAGTSHQRSVFVDAGQSENSEPGQTSSPNQLSDVMINAGLSDKDIEDFLNSETDLESFISNSGFAMELFSDLPVEGGLLSSVFGDKTVMGCEGEQVDVVLASVGTNSEQLVTVGTDYTPPPLYNNNLSFNNMPQEASESHSHPCKALAPGPGTGLSKRSQYSQASSDYCQALFPSTSTANREISGNLTNTSIHDQCVIQVHSQDTVSPQGYGLPRGSSQHSSCHPEPMSVEVLTNGNLDFQENQLDITDQATPTQMEVGAEETFSTNVSIPVSNTTDQCYSQPGAAGAKRVQSIESPSVFKTPVNVQMQPSVRPRRQCHVFRRGINKRKTAVDRGDVGHSGSRRKRSRLESPATHPACSRIRVKGKPGRPRLRKVSYNLRCRSASGQGRPK